MYVHVGRTRAFWTREQALRQRGYGLWEGAGNASQLSFSDRNVAKGAASEGFASIQLLYGNYAVIYSAPGLGGGFGAPTRELILAHDACMNQTTRISSACVPTKTRTGWNAARPCKCGDPASTGAIGLNCGGRVPGTYVQ